jgi:hypothetical protein
LPTPAAAGLGACTCSSAATDGRRYFMIENSEAENFKVGAELSPKKASSKESTHKGSKKINREGNLIIFLTIKNV